MNVSFLSNDDSKKIDIIIRCCKKISEDRTGSFDSVANLIRKCSGIDVTAPEYADEFTTFFNTAWDAE